VEAFEATELATLDCFFGLRRIVPEVGIGVAATDGGGGGGGGGGGITRGTGLV